MAILWADFPSGQLGLYGTDTSYMLNGVWAELVQDASVGAPALVADPDPNIGSAGAVLRTLVDGAGNGRCGLRFVVPTAGKTFGFATRLWMAQLPDNNTTVPFVSFNDGANIAMFAVRVLSTGGIEARSGSTSISGGGSQYGVTASPALVANAWNHIEMKVFSSAASGTIEVRVNGVVVLDLDTLNTDGDDIAQIVFGANRSVDGYADYWKDVVFWDDTGSEGNDFQGSIAVHDLYPDADIDIGDWTPSTGSTIWDLIDETTPVDTDYGQAADPAPDPVKMGMTDLPDDVTSVRALIPIIRGVKTDGGDCNIQVGLTPNDANWDDGADRPLTTAYTYWWDVSHLSPATSAPWTPTEVNAAYVRLDRTL